MRILIDTNILFGLEDNKIVEESFAKFYNEAITNKCDVLYHHNAVPTDIQNDKNHERKVITLSKLEKYQRLEDVAKPTSEFLAMVKNTSNNDVQDNQQLFQLYKGFVEILVTNDKGIHSNARKIDLADRVLNIDEAFHFLKEKYTFIIPQHPVLEHQSIRKIEHLFETKFFDSLRDDYGKNSFNQWLEKCSQQNRQCYSLIIEDKLQAILIYNLEKPNDHQIQSIFDDALKICTLKVNDSVFGVKLGELFLNKMFELCINKEYKYLYLTVYEKQIHLIRLLQKFGFEKSVFQNKQGKNEHRMIKCLDKNKVLVNDNDAKSHPFYSDDKNRKKYVVPIRPEYYRTLFKDSSLNHPSLFAKSIDSLQEIQGNTIIKAYISNATNKQPKKGDILFFYSSQSNQVIEPYCILEDLSIISDFDTLWQTVRRKTVFSEQDLKNMLNKKGKLHVMSFRLISYLDKPIELSKIQQISSFSNKIQTITELKEEDYTKLFNEGYFDKRFIIN